MTTLRLATRASALARWQAEHVAAAVAERMPDVHVELVTVSTEGDRRLDVPLAEIGGKGVFVKEVQAAVLFTRLASSAASDLATVGKVAGSYQMCGLSPSLWPVRSAAMSAVRDWLVEAPSNRSIHES